MTVRLPGNQRRPGRQCADMRNAAAREDKHRCCLSLILVWIKHAPPKISSCRSKEVDVIYLLLWWQSVWTEAAVLKVSFIKKAASLKKRPNLLTVPTLHVSAHGGQMKCGLLPTRPSCEPASLWCSTPKEPSELHKRTREPKRLLIKTIYQDVSEHEHHKKLFPNH